ncbi:hypothetical protein M9Y10_027717 [Tritrichomonas musculus]|uniref:Protein kinase domain-containing protein n=1 Tax=Tritrichomonas musculus TaxID=1915356 RepID=A0ABR2H5P0_9EUKA
MGEHIPMQIIINFDNYHANAIVEDKVINLQLRDTSIFIEIAHGMIHIQKFGLKHRGLQIQNVRLTSVFNAKIAVFGLAKNNEYLIPNYSSTRSTFIKSFGSAVYILP